MSKRNYSDARKSAPFPLALSLAFLFALVVAPGPVAAQSGSDSSAIGVETSSPFTIKGRTQFGCAEVEEVTSGGLASHEITLNPSRVERCLREKVGSRFHDCKKLKIEDSTADWDGIVTLATEDGPVRFWFEEHGENAAELKRVMVWTWPDTDMKYMCAAISSRR